MSAESSAHSEFHIGSYEIDALFLKAESLILNLTESKDSRFLTLPAFKEYLSRIQNILQKLEFGYGYRIEFQRIVYLKEILKRIAESELQKAKLILYQERGLIRSGVIKTKMEIISQYFSCLKLEASPFFLELEEEIKKQVDLIREKRKKDMSLSRNRFRGDFYDILTGERTPEFQNWLDNFEKRLIRLDKRLKNLKS